MYFYSYRLYAWMNNFIDKELTGIVTPGLPGMIWGFTKYGAKKLMKFLELKLNPTEKIKSMVQCGIKECAVFAQREHDFYSIEIENWIYNPNLMPLEVMSISMRLFIDMKEFVIIDKPVNVIIVSVREGQRKGVHYFNVAKHLTFHEIKMIESYTESPHDATGNRILYIELKYAIKIRGEIVTVKKDRSEINFRYYT